MFDVINKLSKDAKNSNHAWIEIETLTFSGALHSADKRVDSLDMFEI